MTEETLFADALKQPTPEARRAWLDRTCADQPALRQRLEALLKAHDDAGSFLAAAAAVEAANPDAGKKAESAAGDRNTPVSEPTLAETHTSAPSELAFLTPSTTPGSLGRLAHYEVLQVLGQGGFGVVLKARDTALERIVAIKVMSGPMLSAGTARKRFIREAQAAAAVIHDNVVIIHEVKSDDLPYLVMQYIHGQTLQDKLDRAGPLELKEILRIGMQIASGLAAAHAQGLVHRDIKPANILLENGVERVKITDFGLARAVDDASLTQSGVIAGTPQYMSPEQAQGEAVDHRADLFSLGSVLYALCTGHPPFRASGSMAVLKRVIEDTPRPVRETNPDVPEWLEAIIAKLHAKKREGRFQSAAEVAQLLGQHLAHVQQPSLTPRPEPVAPPQVASAVAMPDSSWPTTLLILYLVPGLLFALMIMLLGYHGARGRLLANWPSDVAVGLLAVSALSLALVARRRWKATPATTVSNRQSEPFSAPRGAALMATRRPLWPMVLLGAFCLAGILLFLPVGEEFNHVDGSVTSIQSFSWESLLLVFCVAALYGFVILWWIQPAPPKRGAPAAECLPLPAGSPGRPGPAGPAETLLRLAGGLLWAGMLFCYIFAILAALAGLFGLGAPTSFLVALGLCAATAAAAVIVGRRWGGWCSRAGAIWLNAGCVLVAAAAGFGATWHFSAPRGSEPSPPPNTVHADNADPRLDDLRRLVDLKKTAVELAKNRFRVGVLSPDGVSLAEIDLLESQIRLAEAEQNLAAVTQFGKDLVQRHEERLEWTKKLFETGRVTPEEVNTVEQELLRAKVRFPGAAAPPSKDAGPAPGKRDTSRVIRFNPAKDVTIARDGISVEDGAWKLVPPSNASYVTRLFELRDVAADHCTVTLSGQLKTVTNKGFPPVRAQFELNLVRPGLAKPNSLPPGGSMPVAGTTAWSGYAVSVVGRPNLVAVNLRTEGQQGAVWIKDLEVVLTPVSQHALRVELDKLDPPMPAVAKSVRKFAPPKDSFITLDNVTAAKTGWKIEHPLYAQGAYRMFELRDHGLGPGTFIFRMRLKTETPPNYYINSAHPRLEFRPAVLGEGKERLDVGTPVIVAQHNTNWSIYEVRARCLEAPEVIAPQFVFDGVGTVWIEDVELLHAP